MTISEKAKEEMIELAASASLRDDMLLVARHRLIRLWSMERWMGTG